MTLCCWTVLPGNGQRIHAAFAPRQAPGLMHLATTELHAACQHHFAYARDFVLYLTRLCQTPAKGQNGTLPSIEPPSETDLAFQVLQARRCRAVNT